MTAQNLSQNVLPIEEQIMPEAELRKILFELNNTASDYPADKCIHQLFEEQVARTPDAIAVVFAQQELTYQQLNHRANQLARHLQTLGVGPEVLVGICIERSLLMIVGLLAILKAGGAYVPLDPRLPQERLTYMLSNSQASVLLTHSSLAANHLSNVLSHQTITVVCLDTDSEDFCQNSKENPSSGATPKNLAYVIYTSGSTGKPKGVQILHQSVVNFLTSMSQYPGLNEQDVLLAVTTISFDIAGLELYLPMVVGGRVVLVTQEVASDASRLLQTLAQSGATVMQATPATWQMLLAAGWQGNQHLKILCGGEAMHRELANQLLAKSASVWNMYGPTETTIWSAVYRVEPGNTPVFIGKPIANTQIYIVDLDTHQNTLINLVPIGEPGELLIGGVGLARGYLNLPELTTEKFIQNPFLKSEELGVKRSPCVAQRSRKEGFPPGELRSVPSLSASGLDELEENFSISIQNSKLKTQSVCSERLYKTGDLCRLLPDGNIEFFGRIDHQVKVRGFRIELGEIEAVLEQHPTVGQAIVIAQEDHLGDKRLVAYVVTHVVSGEEVKQEIVPSLRNFLQGKLPEYMLPTAFGILEKLPLTPNGKVDRRVLASLPVDSYLLSEKTYVAPRTPQEEMLARLWAEVLGLERVGIHDNFFELGGNSLKVIVLLNRLQELLGKTCQMIDLFNAPTIAEFTATLGEKSSSSLDTIDSIATSPKTETSYYSPSFFQERFWIYRKLGSFYYTPNYFRLTGQLDVATLEKSFNEIIRRHEMLRTTLQEVNGSVMQVVAPTATVNMSVIELPSLPEQEQLKEAERLIQEVIQSPVALERDPWLRVTLLQLGAESYILLICMHYIMVDEKSIEILLEELSILYEAFLSSKSSPLPPLPLQFGDYTNRQRQSLTPEILEARRNYWQQWLSQEPPLLELPIDRPLPAVQTFRVDTLEYQISPELTHSLLTLSQQRQVTLFTTILTAFATLLYRVSGCEDIVIGAPATARNHWQIESLIGEFVNMLVIHIDLKGNPSFWELLTRVRQEMLSVIANQDVPFDLLVKTQPSLKRNKPFFTVYLDSLRNSPVGQLNLPGLTVTSEPIKESMARVNLGLLIWEQNTSSGRGLQMWWRYKTDLFETDTIARMAENFQSVLEAIVADPEQSIRNS